MMKKTSHFYLVLITILIQTSLFAQGFVTTWTTTTTNEHIDIPITGTNIDVVWESGGGTETFTTAAGSITHTYGTAGTYQVTITSTNPFNISFNNTGHKDKIMSIDDWGTNAWTSMANAFYGCTNLVVNATDTPILTSVTDMNFMFTNATSLQGTNGNWAWNTSSVTSMSTMFHNATAFNGDISNWDTAMVTNMSWMFHSASSFNRNINTNGNNWNTSEVTSMTSMFFGASAFNGNIVDWDTSKVTFMGHMFFGASAFNRDISTNINKWNTSKVAHMSGMFSGSAFNGDISNWDTGMVTNMSSMFSSSAFNGDISNWDTAMATNMSFMFYNASAFDQNLGGWNVANVTNFANMFQNSGLSTPNYDALLIGWSAQILQANASFSAGNTKYCSDAAVAAKSILTDPSGNNWAINDGGEVTTTTWTGTGTNNTDWSDSGNWDFCVPTSSKHANIPNTTNKPIISSSTQADVDNLTIDASSSLTIDSGGSLIVQGTASGTGTITYNRNLGTSNWYLVSSPVVGQDIDDFVAASNLETGIMNINNLSLGSYTTADDAWSYYQSGTSNTDTFTAGQGYSINLKAASGDISFTGTMNVSDVSVALTTTGNRYNLLGNPYPSYINSVTMLTTNEVSIDTKTIWIWDQSANAGAGGYVTKVEADNFQIAPGQGFFVQSDGVAGNVDINKAFQSHQTTDTFLRSTTTRPEVSLTLTDGTNLKEAKLYYIDGTTIGFDNGYDGPMFGGVSNSFAIYTHAVANGNGRNLAVQSLPNNDFENLIIPIGINADNGTEITISASSVNLPVGINVYLEDKDDNTFTLLDASSDFTTTLSSNLNGIGRFYIHTTSQVLAVDTTHLNHASIYKTTHLNLRLTGLPQGDTSLKIYTILGTEVLDQSFQTNGVTDILLPSLTAGVYLIKIKTEFGELNKKIIME